jgi:branched-chain amino acid aminotransferase
MASTHSALPDPRNADVVVYVDGEYLPRDRATVSVFDSAFTVGDGIWEGIRVHHGRLAFLDRHLDRLFHAIEVTGIDPGLDRGGLTDLLYEVLVRNAMTDGVHLRLMISRGTKSTPSQHPSNLVSGPTVVVVPEHKTADPSLATSGIALHTSSVRRPPPDTLDQRLNTHSKLHEVLALREAVDAGADEALMLDVHGHVATCNATHFFLVSDGEVWTSTGEHCLAGISRAIVIELCEANGIPIHRADFTPDRARRADEAFVTGTFGGLTPVRRIDEAVLPSPLPGPVTARLRELYAAAVEAEVRP